MPLIKYENISADEALLESMKMPSLRICTGSRMYGTYRTDELGNITSDTDLRDIVIPPYEFLTILKGDFETRKGNVSDDHVVYSLNFFVNKLLTANAQFLELLFVPKNMILIQDQVGKELLEMKDAFISKKFYYPLSSFAYSEFRKAQGVKLEFEKETLSEKQVWDLFRETFGPKWGEDRGEIADKIKALAFSKHEIKLVPSVDGISKKRRDEFERFGYCSSSACHSLRLLRQTTELLLTGTMTFPRPDAIELRDIKMGKSTLEAFTKLYEEAKKECEDAFKNTKLPEKADSNKVHKWVRDKIVFALRSDERLDQAFFQTLDLDLMGFYHKECLLPPF